MMSPVKLIEKRSVVLITLLKYFQRYLKKILCFFLFLSWSLSGAATADDYPARPVSIIIPLAPGTATDATFRLLAGHLQRELGQPFLIENKPGGGTTLGGRAAVAAAPDGYTLFVGGNTANSAVKALIKNVPYDPIADFTPIAKVADLPVILVVNSSVPVRNLHEFVAYAKAHPGALEFGYGNAAGRVVGEAFQQVAGVKFTMVAYRGNPQATSDLIAGHIKVMATDFNTGLPQIEAGKIRVLAATGTERSPLLPDVPSISETIAPNFDVRGWNGLFGPAKLPASIAERLNPPIQRFLSDPDVQKRLTKGGAQAAYLGPEQLRTYLSADAVRWTKMIQDAGITPE